MSDDVELDYGDLIQDAQKRAYRFLMRDVLKLVAELGDAPGDHHFFIEFVTEAPGVSIPKHLSDQYPELMTIVLQHQFENLVVSDEHFGVTLWFKGIESRLEIPFDAVTQFADPSAQFGIRFDADAGSEPGDSTPAPSEAADSDNLPESDKGTDSKADKDGESADVVSLDAFRKK
ncbi:SspB family protein [Hyphococcus sp.]|uniref:SspB family protein n=1 Tax=Hyphococcus sp. TaxID=2038636 RepID=UPI003CCBA782